MKAQKSKKDRLLTWLYLAILLFLILFLFFNKYGLLKYFELKNEIQSIEREIERSKNEIEDLDKSRTEWVKKVCYIFLLKSRIQDLHS